MDEVRDKYEGVPYIGFPDEVSRMKYTIEKFKRYDSRRKNYIANLHQEIASLKEKVKSLESLTERQHEEIDELIDAYNCAKPLISDPKQKAYVYELIRRSREGKSDRKKAAQYDALAQENRNLREENKSLKQIIHNLHNGTGKKQNIRHKF